MIGLIVGLIIGVAFLYFATSSYVDSSNTTWGEWLFPYAIVTDPSLFAKPLAIIALSLIQFPLYGTLLGFFSARRRRTLVLFVVIVICIHLLAALVARSSRAEYLTRSVAITKRAT